MIDLPLWAAIIGYVIGIAGAFGGALAVARSKYKAKTAEEREKYIQALEDRTKLLEAKDEQQTKLVHELKGQVDLLTRMVMGRCPWADIDPENGRCRNCNRTAMLVAEFGGK